MSVSKSVFRVGRTHEWVVLSADAAPNRVKNAHGGTATRLAPFALRSSWLSCKCMYAMANADRLLFSVYSFFSALSKEMLQVNRTCNDCT